MTRLHSTSAFRQTLNIVGTVPIFRESENPENVNELAFQEREYKGGKGFLILNKNQKGFFSSPFSNMSGVKGGARAYSGTPNRVDFN